MYHLGFPLAGRYLFHLFSELPAGTSKYRSTSGWEWEYPVHIPTLAPKHDTAGVIHTNRAYEEARQTIPSLLFPVTESFDLWFESEGKPVPSKRSKQPGFAEIRPRKVSSIESSGGTIPYLPRRSLTHSIHLGY